MNKLVAALSVSTAICASAALYFRHQLIEERMAAARSPSEAARVQPHAPALAEPPAPVQSPPSTAAQAAAGVTAPVAASQVPEASGEQPSPSDANKIRMRERAAVFLRKYDNEYGRLELAEQQMTRARESLAGFDRQRNLDSATWQKLIALVADQELEKQALAARCAIDPLCVMPPGLSELLTSNKQAIQQLIGEDGFKEMQDWRMAEFSRRAASGLSARLPAQSALSSSQFTALAAALQGERNSFTREYRAAGQHIVGFSSMEGMTVMYADQATSEERTLSAQNYVQRVRDRAATVLRGEQLTVFNQMQDELLLDFERYLRRKDQKP